jgi:DNA uptake protein ComE-like DNA-binding protein
MADKTVGKTRNAKSDLNRADRDELVSVRGIGPAAAESIQSTEATAAASRVWMSSAM